MPAAGAGSAAASARRKRATTSACSGFKVGGGFWLEENTVGLTPTKNPAIFSKKPNTGFAGTAGEGVPAGVTATTTAFGRVGLVGPARVFSCARVLIGAAGPLKLLACADVAAEEGILRGELMLGGHPTLGVMAAELRDAGVEGTAPGAWVEPRVTGGLFADDDPADAVLVPAGELVELGALGVLAAAAPLKDVVRLIEGDALDDGLPEPPDAPGPEALLALDEEAPWGAAGVESACARPDPLSNAAPKPTPIAPVPSHTAASE